MAKPRPYQRKKPGVAANPLPADFVKKAIALVKTPGAILATFLLPFARKGAENAILVSKTKEVCRLDKIHYFSILRRADAIQYPTGSGKR